MKKTGIVALVTFICSFAIAQSPAQDPSWELVWEDEFTSFDNTKWKKRGPSPGRWQEWWNPNNVEILPGSGGTLKLKAKMESNFGSDYSAAEISTDLPNGNFKYGYFEARIKIPEGTGFFPAFWLSVKHHSGDNFTWPPELDILEVSGHENNYDVTGTNQVVKCTEEGADLFRGYDINPSGAGYPFQPYNYYHIYGMEWNEYEVKFYIDNVEVGTTLTENIPHDFMRIVLSLQLNHIPVTGMGDLTVPNSSMYVDWVRVHRPIGTQEEEDYAKWDRLWHSATLDTVNVALLGEFHLNDDDKHVAGDFNNDGIDEMLSISEDMLYAKLHQYNDAINEWSKLWDNAGFPWIAPWYMNVDDQFFAGDFNNDGTDELLCLGGNGLNAKLVNYTGSGWLPIWDNLGNSYLGSWNTGVDDRYLICDFDGNGSDDVICFSASGLYCKVLSYSSGNWITLYGNGGSGKIIPNGGSHWNLGVSDIYQVGDFDGDGKGELLMINENNHHAKLFEFGKSAWNYRWGNGGNGKLNVWSMTPGSKYYAYDLDEDNKTDIFCISADNKYEEIIKLGGVGNYWYSGWKNNGSYQIYNRDLVDTDHFIFGRYTNASPNANAFWIKKSWNMCIKTHAYLHELPPLFTEKPGGGKSKRESAGITNQTITIYPNPSSTGIVTIEGIDKDAQIMIHDLAGKLVFSSQFQSEDRTFEIGTLKTGIYVITIKTLQEVHTERIIIE